MNAKTAKRLRRTAKIMAIEFLKPLMSAEQAEQLTVEKLKEFEADQEYVYTQAGERILPAFCSRQHYKKLKKAFYGRPSGKKTS